MGESRLPHVEVLRVTSVVAHHDYTLLVRFSDGVEGTVDMRARLNGPVFGTLSEGRVFEQVFVDASGGVAWPNGADITPEALYDRVQPTGAVAKRDWRGAFDAAAREKSARVGGMPELCRFFGIVIRMWFDEHEPPHFHAEHGGETASIEIRDGRVETHGFHPRALRLVDEWRRLHVEELTENWERMRRGEPPFPIAPLE